MRINQEKAIIILHFQSKSTQPLRLQCWYNWQFGAERKKCIVKQLAINWLDLTDAFENIFLETLDYYLDTETGQLLMVMAALYGPAAGRSFAARHRTVPENTPE
jgi:hypothetical protein